MPSWMAEFLYVLALSRRTQWALVMGVVFFIGINLLGSHLIANFHLEGPYKALETALSEKMLRKYDKLALFVLISFWVLAFRCYLKDRKRL